MMLSREGVCTDCCAMFAILLGHLGYDCHLIDGQFVNSDGSRVAHTWNYALIDGQFYWFDVRIDQVDSQAGNIRHDFFMISDTSKQAVANRFVIASHISENEVVSHHSAFEYYGYANQVFYEVQVTSEVRFRDFVYDGLRYRRIMPQIKGGIVQLGSVRVTTPERTVIDCIHLFEKVGGLEELLRCIALIPALKEAELLACLSEYDNGYLYQKAGCILSQYAAALGLSEAFFTECKKHLPKGKSYLYERTEDFTFYDEWQIYAPADFSRLTDKGVNDHDAI